VCDKCIKAYVHQGKAYFGLKEYDKARESYQQVLKCDPKKESLMNGEQLGLYPRSNSGSLFL
jgi:tetratricopeptide (TPR) repeat protein